MWKGSGSISNRAGRTCCGQRMRCEKASHKNLEILVRAPGKILFPLAEVGEVMGGAVGCAGIQVGHL